jgi:DNA adenine methylase
MNGVKRERKKRARPLVRWHGGKWMIALWIISFFPKHNLYTEVFGGGASVLLRKPAAPGSEIYNDLDMTIVQIFKVLQDPEKAARLIWLLDRTPYARKEFEWAYEACDDDVEAARRTIVRSFMGYGSDGTAGVYPTGFRSTVTAAGKTPATEWANYTHGLELIRKRVARVTLESKDAFDLLLQFDQPDALHYVDPPYLPETRSQGNRRRGKGFHVYQHELTREDHIRLLELLPTLSGMVVLSGYPSELYDDMLAGWRREERASYADGGGARTEVVWINPLCAQRLELEATARRAARAPLFAGEEHVHVH